jgi:hypothetical protein
MKELTAPERRVVRDKVDSFLRQNPNFSRLSAAQQADVREATAKVVERMVTDAPEGGSDPYAVALEGAPVGQVVGDAGKLLKDKGGQLGDAIAVGVTQAARMVSEIDFPKFVAELISGTFHAIVTSSIEQMKAYAEMVKSVSTSLNDFKDKNTTENQARDHLVQKYPRMMQITIVDGQPKILPRDDYDGDVPDFGEELGLGESITSLDEDVIEEKLVPAARDELARGRQQLLATTILMGINRIIVTDGKINAKIKFNFSVNEQRQMKAQAFDYANMGYTYTQQSEHEYNREGGGGQYESGKYNYQEGNYYASGKYQSAATPNVKVTAQVDMSSDAAIQASGQIMGEVSVNFRSESFPLEKMVDTDQLMQLQRAQGAGRGAPPASAAGAAPPPATGAAPAAAAPR